ncbi:hypothetical protein, conserved [Trypanosoma brucei brucei TREU927]|uniref:Bromo domain-containing protein n=1 Tax=Trypanosoma brucei brucei (strain 927/4 GUTat10.1) TaxID=185431 RepID=Q57UR8_TRYB2|nr:hypothetical protein, conserved [Trypanosoma brucei brucei TREU927]AAX70651.1 hypothetical protein, conserved [Trypanosoma brucei]AAZ12502.1 hypothetical protein, conserved [Trypanosoma brucei brucei TREU927]
MSGGTSARRAPSCSPWQHLVSVDISNTFCTAFAQHLSTVQNPQEFSETLSTLMCKWRDRKWAEITVPSTSTGGRHFVIPTRRRKDRRSIANGGVENNGFLSENFSNGVPIGDTRRDGAVTAYYESIRVQRLMEEVLLLSSEVEAEREAELIKLGEVEGMKAQRRAWRRRCCLTRAVDELWRFSCTGGSDFLLPVTELEAPNYYQRVRRPVSLSTLYCSVWDATVADYADLKALLTLMSCNCEHYNGSDSILAAQCRKLVKIGYRAVRDAETYEKQQLEADQELFSTLCGQDTVGCGPRTGTGTGVLRRMMDANGDGISMEPLPADELAALFPSRYQAACDGAVQSADEKLVCDANGSRTDDTVSHQVNNGGRRLVLRRKPPVQSTENGKDAPVPAHADPSGKPPRPRLRLSLVSSTSTKTETRPSGGSEGEGGGILDEDDVWEKPDRVSSRQKEGAAISISSKSSQVLRAKHGRKSLKKEKESRRRVGQADLRRKKEKSDHERRQKPPKVKREKADRGSRISKVKSGRLGGRDNGKDSKRSKRRLEEYSSTEMLSPLPTSSSTSSSYYSSSSTSSSDDSDTFTRRAPPSISVERLGELEAMMNKLDKMPLQQDTIEEVILTLKRVENELN